MVVLYGAAMTLLIAGTFGTPGYLVWGAIAAVYTYRRTLSPRKGTDTSDSSQSLSPSQHSQHPQTQPRSESA